MSPKHTDEMSNSDQTDHVVAYIVCMSVWQELMVIMHMYKNDSIGFNILQWF